METLKPLVTKFGAVLLVLAMVVGLVLVGSIFTAM